MPNVSDELNKAGASLYDAGRAIDGIRTAVQAMAEDHQDAVRFVWMATHGDEAATAMERAYDEWDGDASLWGEVLREHVDAAMVKTP